MNPYPLRLFKLIYGQDFGAATRVTVLGGIVFGYRALIVLFALLAADTPPECTEGGFAPPCTENIFQQIMLPIIFYLVSYWGFWLLLVGLCGLFLKHRYSSHVTDRFVTQVPNKRYWSLFLRIYDQGYTVAVWFVVIGLFVSVRVWLDVAPAFMETGHPPGYAWFGPDRLPPPENFHKDVLVPLMVYVMNTPGFYLLCAGLFGVAVRWRVNHYFQTGSQRIGE